MPQLRELDPKALDYTEGLPPVRLWVVPENDGEAVEIIRLLAEHEEQVAVTRQSWGATWAALEPSIQSEIQAFRAAHPHAPVYGIELGGHQPGVLNIDHHRYGSDDRSHPLSSLEQVAALLHLPLTRRGQLVAANDRGFIPAMLALGATQEEIRDVRRQDLAAQGVTLLDENAQRAEVAAARPSAPRAFVRTRFDPPTAIPDILFLDYGIREWLIAAPTLWTYSGPRTAQLVAARFPEHHWSGGAPGAGYFGIFTPSPATRQALLDFWAAG